MPPGVQQWVWVCDFHGFGMADINPKLAKAFLDISAEHYPEVGMCAVGGCWGGWGQKGGVVGMRLWFFNTQDEPPPCTKLTCQLGFGAHMGEWDLTAFQL